MLAFLQCLYRDMKSVACSIILFFFSSFQHPFFLMFVCNTYSFGFPNFLQLGTAYAFEHLVLREYRDVSSTIGGISHLPSTATFPTAIFFCFYSVPYSFFLGLDLCEVRLYYALLLFISSLKCVFFPLPQINGRS